METMIKEYLASMIRNILAPAIIWASANGYITESDATNFAIAVATIVIAVVWGVMNKYLWKKAAATALALPSTTSELTLKEVIANPTKPTPVV